MSELKVKYAVVTGCYSSHYNRCLPPPAHSQPRWRGWTAGGLLQLDVAKLRSEGKSWLSRTLDRPSVHKKDPTSQGCTWIGFLGPSTALTEDVSILSLQEWPWRPRTDFFFQMEALIF